MPRLAARRDANEVSLIETLRSAGCIVVAISGKGVPDLLVWSPFLKLIVLLEVKDGRKNLSSRKLTDDQVLFHAQWKAAGAPVHKVSNAAQALIAVGTKPARGRKVAS